jgi:hypothetical protein
MTPHDAPAGELDRRYSSPEAGPTAWDDVRRALEEAPVYWLATAGPAGRPHVTPLIGAWVDGAVWSCTGAGEQKAANLRASAGCAVTTGCNELRGGLDVVVEGDAVPVHDDDRLRPVAAAYEAKYGEEWRFEVRDGVFVGEGGEAVVYEVRPVTVRAFARDPYAQTRWRLGG